MRVEMRAVAELQKEGSGPRAQCPCSFVPLYTPELTLAAPPGLIALARRATAAKQLLARVGPPASGRSGRIPSGGRLAARREPLRGALVAFHLALQRLGRLRHLGLDLLEEDLVLPRHVRLRDLLLGAEVLEQDAQVDVPH